MRTCGEYEELISAFIDGALPEREQAELMEHMAGCTGCQQYFDDQIALHDALSGLEDVPAPADLAGRVMEQVRSTAQERPARRGPGPLPRWGRWAALAACCALVLLGAWRLLGPDAGFTSQSAVSSCAADTAAPEESEAQEEAAPALDGAVPAEARLAPKEAEDDAAPQEEAPALCAPAAPGTEAYRDNAKVVEEPATLSTASPTAGRWVEEHLGLTWRAGGVYQLTEEEYAALRGALEEAGEEFSEVPGGDGWALLAE